LPYGPGVYVGLVLESEEGLDVEKSMFSET
jgi:hypothetical protein